MSITTAQVALHFNYAKDMPHHILATGTVPEILALEMKIRERVFRDRGIKLRAISTRYATGSRPVISNCPKSLNYPVNEESVTNALDQMQKIMAERYVCRCRTGDTPSPQDPIIKHGCYMLNELHSLVNTYRKQSIVLDIFVDGKILAVSKMTKTPPTFTINAVAEAELSALHLVVKPRKSSPALLKIHASARIPEMTVVVARGTACRMRTLRNIIMDTLTKEGHVVPNRVVSAQYENGNMVSDNSLSENLTPISAFEITSIISQIQTKMASCWKLRVRLGRKCESTDPIIPHMCCSTAELTNLVYWLNKLCGEKFYMTDSTVKEYRAASKNQVYARGQLFPQKTLDYVLAEYHTLFPDARLISGDTSVAEMLGQMASAKDAITLAQGKQTHVADPRELTNKCRFNRFMRQKNDTDLELQAAENKVTQLNAHIAETLSDLDIVGLLSQSLDGRANSLTLSQLISELTTLRKKQAAELIVAKRALKAARSAKTKHESSLLVAAAAS